MKRILSRSRSKSPFYSALVAIPLAWSILQAGDGVVDFVSTNRVSPQVGNLYRFEPSSSASSTWVTSWAELQAYPGNFASYTTWWNTNTNSWASPPFLQQSAAGLPAQDVYLTTNPQGQHVLSGLDTNFNVFFKTSTDSTGASWNPPVTVISSADYPSVAVASNGTIAIAFNQASGGEILGFQSMFSTDGGQTWSGPYQVTNSYTRAFGRIVAVGNTFYVILPDLTSPASANLNLYQWNGSTWGLSQTLSTYTAPSRYSPNEYCTSGGQCGYIHYATSIDAQASSSGWAVVFPASRSDYPAINNLIFCAQNIGGCVPITYSIDLFLQGITTSLNGDLWLSMWTYSGAPNRVLPLSQIAIYRSAGGSYANGEPNTGIDPTSWAYFPQNTAGSASRCDAKPCYSAGDYMRTAMNAYTGATLPFVIQSPYSTDLQQTFVLDPPVGLPSVPGLSIGRVMPFGSDNRYKGQLSPADIAIRTPSPLVSALTAK